MVVHDGFATTTVQAGDHWEQWTAWCVGPLVACSLNRFDKHVDAERFHETVVRTAVQHDGDELARSVALEVDVRHVADGEPVALLHDADRARNYFVARREDHFLTMIAHALVEQVMKTCETDDATPPPQDCPASR